MNIAVTGLLGGTVRDRLVNLGFTPINSDITLEQELKDEIYRINPDVVVHAAAVTDVDKCEANHKLAFNVNVRGTTYVAEACRSINAKLLYLSTCHIFDGKSWSAYTEQSIPRPANIYGMTKWEGEVSATIQNPSTTIIRISKLFDGKTFEKHLTAETVIRPAFIQRNYIHVDHFCSILMQLIQHYYNLPTIMNVSGADAISDNVFWEKVFRFCGYPIKVIPNDKDDTSYVPRPHQGILGIERLLKFGISVPSITQGIGLVKQELLGEWT